MDPTRELVDAGQVGIALAVLSGASLLAAGVSLALARRRKSDGLTRFGLVAAALVLLWPMWRVYNAIEDHFGLDSVAALLLNLILFLALGGVLGLAYRRLWPYTPEPTTSSNTGGK